MAWTDILGAILGKNVGMPSGTGGYPNGGVGSPPSAGSSSPWWAQLAGLALPVTAAALQNNSIQNKNNQIQTSIDALNKMAQQEQARKSYYASVLMPNILRGLGQTNPGVLQQAQQNMTAPGGAGFVAPPNTTSANTTYAPTSGVSPSTTDTQQYDDWNKIYGTDPTRGPNGTNGLYL